jgi:DNA-binding CsgD family transcriptional regulator
LRWAATAYADRGDATGVRACAEALATIAAQTGQPEAVATLALALGEAARLDGDAQAAADHLDRALEALAARDLPLERAEIGRRSGLALVAAGRRTEGLPALETAARMARRLGAGPLAEAIGEDLRRLGESVERRLGRREAARLANGGLTGRELEVLRLVARGMTSREIGRALFISPRTVEIHVGSALTKLDCRTRAEAARRLASLGLREGRPAGTNEGPDRTGQLYRPRRTGPMDPDRLTAASRLHPSSVWAVGPGQPPPDPKIADSS